MGKDADVQCNGLANVDQQMSIFTQFRFMSNIEQNIITINFAYIYVISLLFFDILFVTNNSSPTVPYM